MFWVFIILGLASSTLALHSLAVSAMARRGISPLLWGVAAMLLVGVAWFTGHASWISWVALIAALAIEILRRIGHSDSSSAESKPEAEKPEFIKPESKPEAAPPALHAVAEENEETTLPEDATHSQDTRATVELDETDRPSQHQEPHEERPQEHPLEERSDDLPKEGSQAKLESQEPPTPVPDDPQVDDAPLDEVPLLDDTSQTPRHDLTEDAPQEAPSHDAEVDEQDEPPPPPREHDTTERPEPESEPVSDSPKTPPQNPPQLTTKPQPQPKPVPLRRECPFVTMVLLESPSKVVAEVFVASLRRGGERSAEWIKAGSRGGAIHVRVGEIDLHVENCSGAVSRSLLEYATNQSWDWPEAAEAVAGHTSHIILTSDAGTKVPPADTVRLHHQAHAALAEFAPMIAALWPNGGILSPPSSLQALRDLASDDPALLSSFVSFRTFPPEEWDGDEFISDTAGLHAMGLPDYEVATSSEPDDQTSTLLYEMADLAFKSPNTPGTQTEINLGDLGRWRIEQGRSRFPPERDVLVLSPLEDPQEKASES